MTTWAEYRESIKNLTLKITEADFDDEQVLTAFNWAQNDLCLYAPNITEVVFDDTVENPDTSAPYVMGQDTEFKLLVPPYPTPRDMQETCAIWQDSELLAYARNEFRILRDNRLAYVRCANAPETTLTAVYYSYWTPIVDDADELLFPIWAESAVKYRAASHLMISLVYDLNTIAEFRSKRDSGSPDDNPIMLFSAWLEKMWQLHVNPYAPFNKVELWR